MIIGLTGMYCAGKNYIARFLEERGLPVLDVDRLGHQVIEAEKKALLERFGGDILALDGTIDRKLLGERVFGRPRELEALEALIHPGVNRITGEWIAAQKSGPCVINAALLHRSSAFERLDAVILAEAPVLTRLLRARKRDKLSWAALIKRFRSQKNFRSQYFAKNTDIYRVENRGFWGFNARRLREKLERRIDEIISRLGLG